MIEDIEVIWDTLEVGNHRLILLDLLKNNIVCPFYLLHLMANGGCPLGSFFNPLRGILHKGWTIMYGPLGLGGLDADDH